ncbi:MAG: gliding motility-associated C-terminal domain-containing protein, partial [Paludibacteraceae bacterium]|nr:gliding motility-associated C-terminal domain-containing protein [Paludibacteraceae bacterium]
RLIADGADKFVWREESTGKIEEGRYLERENMKAGANKFYITGTSVSDCKNTKEFTLWVYKNPTVKIHDTLIGCPNTDTEAEFSIRESNIISCEWRSNPLNGDLFSNSAKKVSGTITEPTEVYVVAYDANRCASYDTIKVDALQFNPIRFDVSPTTIDENSNVIEMTGIFPETENWNWLTDDGASETRGRMAKHTYTNTNVRDSFIVTARAYDDKGCLYEGDTIVYVWKDFWAPNAFTPNEDDMNDCFKFLGTEFMTEFHWRIFDRTGRIIFESDDKNAKWDGRDKNGEKCEWGVYGYIVEYKSIYKGINKTGEKRGTVTLIR